VPGAGPLRIRPHIQIAQPQATFGHMRLVAPADHRVADQSAVNLRHETIEPTLGSDAVAHEIVRIEGGLGILQDGSQFARHLCDGSSVPSCHRPNACGWHWRLDKQGCRIIPALRRSSIGRNGHKPPVQHQPTSRVLVRSAGGMHRGTRHSVS